MKKIAILTEHRARNHGSCLQAYALQQVVKSMDYDCEIVDYRPQAIEDTFGVFIRCLMRDCGKNPIKLAAFFANTIVFAPLRIRREFKFYRYRRDKFCLSQQHYSHIDTQIAKQLKYDTYICGSDQIWNPRITQGMDPVYFAFPFDSSARKISYAASIGLSELTKSDAEDFVRLLTPLDKVTVREPSAATLIADLSDKPAEVVLDPTLLLKKEDWETFIANRKGLNKKYILVYSLKVDDKMIEYANHLSQKTGLPVLFFDLRRRYGKHSISKYTADPVDFLRYLHDAEYVVTNSFHGTVFSVIFGKQFVCVPMQGTSSRMIDLLEHLGLDNRLLYDNVDIDQPIDYTHARKILGADRVRSLEILKNAIERED